MTEADFNNISRDLLLATIEWMGGLYTIRIEILKEIIESLDIQNEQKSKFNHYIQEVGPHLTEQAAGSIASELLVVIAQRSHILGRSNFDQLREIQSERTEVPERVMADYLNELTARVKNS